MSQPPSDQPAPQGQPAYPYHQGPGQPGQGPAPYQQQPYPPQYGTPGGYSPPQQPHPGYGATPPAGAAPRHPGYGPNPPGGPAQPGQPGAPGPQQARGVATRNPLGLAALVLGAIGPVLGFLFVFIQAAVFASGGGAGLGPISAVQGVLVGLTALAAVILGLVAISRPGSPKALASAGLALGAAGLLSVLSGLLYPVVASIFYG